MKSSTAEAKREKEPVSAVWKYVALGSITLLLLGAGIVGFYYCRSLNFNKYGFPYGKFSNGTIEAEFN